MNEIKLGKIPTNIFHNFFFFPLYFPGGPWSAH